VLVTVTVKCKIQVRVHNKVVLSTFFATTVSFIYSPSHTDCTDEYELRTVVRSNHGYIPFSLSGKEVLNSQWISAGPSEVVNNLYSKASRDM